MNENLSTKYKVLRKLSDSEIDQLYIQLQIDKKLDDWEVPKIEHPVLSYKNILETPIWNTLKFYSDLLERPINTDNPRFNPCEFTCWRDSEEIWFANIDDLCAWTESRLGIRYNFGKLHSDIQELLGYRNYCFALLEYIRSPIPTDDDQNYLLVF